MRRGLFKAKIDEKVVRQLLEERGEGAGKGEAGRGGLLPRLRLPGLRAPKPGVRLPRIRARVVRARARSALEGAETLEVVPAAERVLRLSSGYVMLMGDVAAVYPRVEDAPFGPLQPLVELDDLQELFIAEGDGQAQIVATIGGRRYRVVLPRELMVDMLAERIAIASGISISERNPQASGEYHGWRVNLTMPLLSGGWQITLTRLTRLSSISFDPLLTARLVTLLASPASALIYGPPGSGKTTLLIHLVNTFTSLFPSANVSIVEKDPEVAVHVKAPNVRKYFSFGGRTVTDNIRATRRYDRPDLLVVGELGAPEGVLTVSELISEVLSWFEAAGSGIPVVTTVHARGLKDLRRRIDAAIQGAGISGSVLDVVSCFVSTAKILASDEVRREVAGVYFFNGESFVPLYRAGVHAPEEDFLRLLPPRLQFSFSGEGARETYELIKERLGVSTHSYTFAKLEPVAPDEVPE
jgi:type IV secretory pathway ATPase VirB11/archaellum biosynthesis ATPase